MKQLSELQREIEAVRKELDAAARESVRSSECYRISIRLDRLMEDYMQFKTETC